MAIGVAGSRDVPIWCGVADVVRYCPPDSGYPTPSSIGRLPRSRRWLMPERQSRHPSSARSVYNQGPLRHGACTSTRAEPICGGIEGDPLVMLGFGQVAGSGGSAEGTSTTTHGCIRRSTRAEEREANSQPSVRAHATDLNPRIERLAQNRYSHSQRTAVRPSSPTLARSVGASR